MSGKTVVAKEDSAFCHYEVFNLLRRRCKNVQKICKIRTVQATFLVFAIRRQSVICCSEKQSLAGFEVATPVVGHAWAVVHRAGKLESFPQLQFMSSPADCVVWAAIVARELLPQCVVEYQRASVLCADNQAFL